MLSLESAQDVLPVLAHGGAVTAPPPALPCWAGRAPDWTAAPPPAEPDLPSPLAPSRPENAALGLVPQAESPLAERDATGTRFLRGQLVHALLQHLPAVQEQDREGAARRYLSAGHGLTDAAVSDVVADVFAVLGDAELAPLFGPDGRAEVPLTGVIGGAVIGGLVDRLAVFPDRVMVADYKTNRAPPTSATAAPLLYLRQMAAYRAVLAEIFPGRTIDCALVWTTGGKIMWLPQALLDRHAPGAMVAA
jgi:ATP-dependent helicase/nuclease subunit A